MKENKKNTEKDVMFLTRFNLIWILNRAQKFDFMPYYVVTTFFVIANFWLFDRRRYSTMAFL